MSDWHWRMADPFTMNIRVSEQDVDRLGHANNTVYLQWMEEISWAHIESVGLTWELQEELGRAMAIVRTEIDYKAAALADDDLILGTWLTEFDGKLRSGRQFQLVRPSDGRTLVEAESRHVCIDTATQRPARIPEPMAELLKKASHDQ
ncbi:thioesterase [Halovibrio salipaludis]|jgi:acyl-CoA thioester hydrolase|uniref:Thioesterase n=1 Tax=Halovibrio salipaludis TaxID=2032626 RepID=A0A2A2FCE5_9GAMM|nr:MULTISPECIES: thioesterase family protein [Gammaproteobacteria]KAA8981253.1 acyl-CoA thioesterase [Halospina sp. K52047b]PAU82289.1 thioesterase [Halovibrio salipaludis]